MKRNRAKVSMIALILFAAYCVFIAVAAVAAGKGHGSVFWFSIGMILVLAAAALWLSRRMYRRHFGVRNAKPS
jgi:membrane protein implicated in regulation of membrane protease activity